MAGKNLFEAIAFDSPVSSADGYGGQETGWSEEYACRANFVSLRGGEQVLADRLEGVQAVVIRVRACAAVRAATTDWRIRDTRTSQIYNIRSVIETDDRLYLDFTCQRGVAV